MLASFSPLHRWSLPMDRSQVMSGRGRTPTVGACGAAPALFEDDDEGYGAVKGNGPIPPALVERVRLAPPHAPSARTC